jgi:hypothetical protein
MSRVLGWVRRLAPIVVAGGVATGLVAAPRTFAAGRAAAPRLVTMEGALVSIRGQTLVLRQNRGAKLVRVVVLAGAAVWLNGIAASLAAVAVHAGVTVTARGYLRRHELWASEVWIVTNHAA